MFMGPFPTLDYWSLCFLDVMRHHLMIVLITMCMWISMDNRLRKPFYLVEQTVAHLLCDIVSL